MNDKMEQSAKSLDVDNGQQDRIFEVMNKVFGVDLLLDMILDHLIHDKKNKMTVWNCRLVSKSWLLSINRIFRKNEKPLFVFNPAAKADQFLKSVMGNLHLDKHVPPYAIIGNASPILFDCLSNCGSGLIELDLRLNTSDKMSPHVSLTNNFLLPRLCKFSALMWSSNKPNRENRNKNRLKLIQKIFDASEQLKSFMLFSGPSSHKVHPADCFGDLLFPSSITHLNFYSPTDSQLEALGNSNLPNLKTLKFMVSSTPIKKRLITSILQNVRKTLQSLHVDYGGYSRDDRLPTPTTFQLPLMEKLKELDINSRSLELEGGRYSSLQKQLAPMLQKVTLWRQTRSMLRKWADHSCFPNVTFLDVSKVWKDIREDLHSSANIDSVTMHALYMAFPNVKELILSHADSTDMSAPLFIMREMKSLHCLRICFYNASNLQSSDILDAILIGIPQESLGALRESPDLWEGLSVGNDLSIRNLTELQTLELMSLGHPSQFPFITEVAFQYAFMRMPKLTNLILKGGFRATMEMTRMWEREGRTMDS